MSIELKPCPFCGGEAKVITWGALSPKVHGATEVRCTECAAGIECDVSELLVDSADKLWNTRAETTCRIRGGECDQCGAIIHEHANLYWVPVGDGMRTVEHRDVHYCPNCGAKVVEE